MAQEGCHFSGATLDPYIISKCEVFERERQEKFRLDELNPADNAMEGSERIR